VENQTKFSEMVNEALGGERQGLLSSTMTDLTKNTLVRPLLGRQGRGIG